MANYTKATNFTVKDSLTSGDPNKIVKGTEIDTEFIAISSAIASKADLASPALTGVPTAPTATVNSNTSQIATTAFVQTAISTTLTGIIAMWSGSIGTIPTGWVLCDGANGTPDLRDKFVIGARQDNPTVAATNVTGTLTVTGGSKDAIVVSHTHTGTTETHTHNHFISSAELANGGQYMGVYNPGNSDNFKPTLSGTTSVANDKISSNNTHSHTFTTNSTGSSGTNANLPPYYALAFIMKTA